MIQNDGLCTILAIILVLMLFSSGMREWMKTGEMGHLGNNLVNPQGPPSENCGCNTHTPQASPPPTKYASARKSEEVTPEGPAKIEPVQDEKTVTFETTSQDSHSMDALKRNLASSHKYRQDLSQCRTDHIGRSQGARTGFLHVLTDSENRSGKHKPDEFTTFQPFFMAPESRTNPTNYRGSVDLPLSESMFE